jgi:hypothetical protein
MSSCASAIGTAWYSPQESSPWLVATHREHCWPQRTRLPRRNPHAQASTASWHMTWQAVPWWSCNERSRLSPVSNWLHQKLPRWATPPVTGARSCILLISLSSWDRSRKQFHTSPKRKPAWKRLRLDYTPLSCEPPSWRLLRWQHSLLLTPVGAVKANQKHSSTGPGWRASVPARRRCSVCWQTA